jgi:hypothetical protein
LLALVVYPVLGWWLSYNYDACGTQGVQLAVVFLLPLGVLAALPALLLFVAFAFVPVVFRWGRLLAVVSIETVALVVVNVFDTLRHAGTGACSV